MKLKLLFTFLLLAILQVFAKDFKFDAQKDYVFVDLRSIEEASEAHLSSTLDSPALLVPYDDSFKSNLGALALYKDKELLLFCKTGRRAAFAENILGEAGFKNLVNIKTLADAKTLDLEIRANKFLPEADLESLIEHYSSRAGIKADIVSLINEADFDALNAIFSDKVLTNQDVTLKALTKLLSIYISRKHIDSYYIDENHPFNRDDLDIEALNENLEKAFEDFKIQQKKTQQMIDFKNKLENA